MTGNIQNSFHWVSRSSSMTKRWSEVGFVTSSVCLPDMPHGKNTAIRYKNQCGFCKITRASAAQNDAFGIWAYWSVPNGSGYRAPFLWQRKMLALGIFSLLSLAWCTLAPQWVLIDWECHLQSLNIPPPTVPPWFACSIVLHSSCPSIKLGQDSPLKRCVCIISPPTNTKTLSVTVTWGRLASLVSKGPMSVIASIHFVFGVGLSN